MNPSTTLIHTLLVLLLVIFLFFYIKKRKAIQKTQSLSISEKTTLINELTTPLGYEYEPSKDLFLSTLDAPQKQFGYHTFYDYAASFFNMVFDYETIYFDYDNRTWLIELWKGQYGICSGSEVGVYYNETIVTPEDYSNTHFDAVAPEDMPLIFLQLSNMVNFQTSLGYAQKHHWWLTLFKLPHYTPPGNLHTDISIRFTNYKMLSSFLRSFVNTLPDTPYQVRGLTISFPFYKSRRHYRWTQRLVRRIALNNCHLLYTAFRFITRPFTTGGDKVIYLYYYLPFTIRLLFHLPKSINKE